jgi:hypothetical protein
MSKRFIRPKLTAEDRFGISLASFYEGLASGQIDLKQVPILERAVGFDEDEILHVQLNMIADRDGLTGAERETWLDEEFIKEKAQAERVAEYRARMERSRKPRGMHAKKLVEVA